MNRARCIIGLLIAVLISGSAFGTKGNTIEEQLNALFDHLVEQGMYNGGVAVRKSGNIIFRKAYGPANFEKNTLFKPETQTEIASVSKQFTATAIMMLQQEGKLNVEDDINRYFSPRLPFEGIRIKHLLTHTSGVPDYEKYFKENWLSNDLVTNKEILDFVYQENPPLLFSPGEKYTYSNLGYVLLAEIIHKTSGQRLDAFLQQRIFAPNGMQHTAFYDRGNIFDMDSYGPGMVWDMSSCAFVRPEKLKDNAFVWYLSGRYGPGRLTSNLDDLMAWDSILYTDAVLSEESRSLMFSPHVEVPSAKEPAHYGFGWKILAKDTLGHEIEHGGAWPGNYTHLKRYIDDRSAYVLLNNTYTPYMADIRQAIDDILKGRPYTLPKPFLHDFLSKNLCKEGFDEKAWMETNADLSRYKVHAAGWKSLLKKVSASGNQQWIDFMAKVNVMVAQMPSS